MLSCCCKSSIESNQPQQNKKALKLTGNIDSALKQAAVVVAPTKIVKKIETEKKVEKKTETKVNAAKPPAVQQKIFSIGQNGDNTNTVFRILTKSQGTAGEHRIIDVRAQLAGNMKRTNALFVKMGDDEEELPAV